MSLQQISLIVILIPPISFIVIAALVQPPWRVMWLSLLAGLATAVVNMLGDALAVHFGWWRFPGSPAIGGIGQPSVYLVSWLLYGAGIGGLVVGWWVRRKFGWTGATIFLVALPFFGVLRDLSEAHLFPTVTAQVVWGPGFWPWLADFFVWGIAISAACFSLFFLSKNRKGKKQSRS